MSVGVHMWLLFVLELLGMNLHMHVLIHTVHAILCCAYVDSARYPSEAANGKVQSTRSSEEVQKGCAISFSRTVH